MRPTLRDMPAMANTHIFIDYENVQPSDLALVDKSTHMLRVFLGPNQNKLPLAMVSALQPLGERADYIQMDSGGPNALDFYISYTLGVCVTQHPGDTFAIVSKDTGFDPMVRQLLKRGIHVRRATSIAEAVSTDDSTHVDAAVTDLRRRGTSRPRTVKTLTSTLNALFKNELGETQISGLLNALQVRGHVKVDGTKVSYNLPDVEPANESP